MTKSERISTTSPDAQEHYRAEVARAHKGEDYERDEEYKRRAEVAHEEEQSHAHDAEDYIFCKRARCLKLFESRRADKDKRDLYKLRGLNRHPADTEPVESALYVARKNERQDEQSHRRHGHGRSHKHGSVNIRYEPEQGDIAEYAEHIRYKLRLEKLLVRSGNRDKPYAGQEKRHHFERGVGTLSRYRHRNKIHPLDGEIRAEEDETFRIRSAVAVKDDLSH